MEDVVNEFNPNNPLKCHPGTPSDALFERALKENSIRYFRKQSNDFGEFHNYDIDNYYFNDLDFEKAKGLYVEAGNMLQTAIDPYNNTSYAGSGFSKDDKKNISKLLTIIGAIILLSIIVFSWDQIITFISGK